MKKLLAIFMLIASVCAAQWPGQIPDDFLQSAYFAAARQAAVVTLNYGYALNFDGTNDVVNMATNLNAGLISGTTQMTFSAWIKPRVVNVTQAVCWKFDADVTYNCYRLYIFTDGTMYWQIYKNDGSNEYAGPTAPFVAGNWVHVTATADGSTLKIYTNGIQAASAAYSKEIRQANGPLGVGGAWNGATLTYPFDGQIDEVNKFGRGIASNEVYAMYLNSYAQTNISPWNTNCLAILHLDEGAGTNCVDSSTNNFLCTQKNGPTYVTGKVAIP